MRKKISKNQNEKNITTFNLAGLAASGLALTGISADAATVWNVNIGNAGVSGGSEITTLDNYQGAAAENTANSTWNAISSETTTLLDDSTGDNSAGVTFKVTSDLGSAIDFGGQGITGDEIFNTWIKDGGANGPNNDAYTFSFENLTDSSSYALVIYSDWFWGDNAVPVSQTVGTGLSGTFFINSAQLGPTGRGDLGVVDPLVEDTDPLNALHPTDNTNFARLNGLTSVGGVLTFQVNPVDGPINGFQLIQVPEPSSTALLGLGGLALILRRRK